MDEVNKNLSNTELSVPKTEEFGAINGNEPKAIVHKFLKRGQGIKKRFGIDPTKLRLNNLPNYKFAQKTELKKPALSKETPTLANCSDLTSSLLTQTTASNFSRDFPLPWSQVLDSHSLELKSVTEKQQNNVSIKESNAGPELLQHRLTKPTYNAFKYNIKSMDNTHNTPLSIQSDTATESEDEDCSYSNINNSGEGKERKECKINSSLSEPLLFAHFTKALLDELREHDPNLIHRTAQKNRISEENLQNNDKSLPNEGGISYDKELEANTKIIRTRLTELENEIEKFKKDSLELEKLREELELEKVKFIEDQNALKNDLKDERIQFEIYMHEEKMKLEERSRQMEKLPKFSKAKENKILELEQEIEELKNQLKQKCSAFYAAESRTRVLVSNLKKTRDQLKLQNDKLVEENNKLKLDNLKMMKKNISTSMKKPLNDLPISKNQSVAVPILKIKDSPKVYVCQENITKNQFTAVSTPFQKRSEVSSHISGDAVLVNCDKNECLQENDQNAKNVDANPAQQGNFKREVLNEDGSRDIWYPNGNLKKVSSDGMNVRMLYFNRDIKETNIHIGMVKYYYAATNVWHTTYLDGLEILEFPNGQTEHRHKNGMVEVHFPNDSIKITNPTSQNIEEWHFANGTKLLHKCNGDKILLLANGQKEEQTKSCKKRLYPDGTVKTVFPDGSQETRYSNGRIRFKDKDGKLILDSPI